MSPEEYYATDYAGKEAAKAALAVDRARVAASEQNHKPVSADEDGRLSKSDAENTAGWIARRAAMITEGDRAAQHGPKELNHQNIADHWNAYLGKRLSSRLTPLDVALMMVELKIARTKAGAGRINQDNFVDMAGYAACAGEIALKS